MQLTETFQRVKKASRSLALLSDEQRNTILNAVADAIIDFKERILVANSQDLAKMDPKNPLYDRLQLTEKRLDGIASDMRNVASWDAGSRVTTSGLTPKRSSTSWMSSTEA